VSGFRRRVRRWSVAGVLVFVVSGLSWLFSPLEAVLAIRSLSDPAKLAALGQRGANPRVNKLVYWLDTARRKGLGPERAIEFAQTLNGVTGLPAELRREALLRNLTIAERLGLLTPENLDRLRRGNAPTVTLGPYAGEPTEVDHIVPVSLAPEVGNELANLELLPKTVNRRKSSRVGERQLSLAEDLHRAGLLRDDSWRRVRSAAAR
jgi:5-methylcytosine-specific restriction endonuclease McrA